MNRLARWITIAVMVASSFAAGMNSTSAEKTDIPRFEDFFSIQVTDSSMEEDFGTISVSLQFPDMSGAVNYAADEIFSSGSATSETQNITEILYEYMAEAETDKRDYEIPMIRTESGWKIDPNWSEYNNFRASIYGFAFEKEKESAEPLHIVYMTERVANNSHATVQIKGKPNTEYKINVFYPSGIGSADGLMPATSDANGYATWIWKVGRKTKPASHRITVEGGGEKIEFYFETYINPEEEETE